LVLNRQPLPSGERAFVLILMGDDYERRRLVMFIYIFAAGLIADHGHNQSNAALYSVGYFLCGVAVLMTIGCLIMAIKLRKINDLNYKNKKKVNL
jgi:hypothetical protein